jgi:predicted small metal-binding protein
MSKVLECADVTGDCKGVVRGNSEQEIMQGMVKHAKDVHGLDTVPPELVTKARSSIRDE